MASIHARLWHGVCMAASSFEFLWQHPVLLVYLVSTVPLYFCAQVLAYNIPAAGVLGGRMNLFVSFQDLGRSIVEPSGLINHALLFLVTLVYLFVVTFFHACLVRHGWRFMTDIRENDGIGNALRNSWRIRGRIASWSFMATFVNVALYFIAASASSRALLLPVERFAVIAFFLGWSLCTFFFVPIVVFENESATHSLLRSAIIARQLFVEIMGAQCWMLVITAVCLAPLATIAAIFGRPAVGAWYASLSIAVTFTMVLIGSVVSSAQTILKTELYLLRARTPARDTTHEETHA